MKIIIKKIICAFKLDYLLYLLTKTFSKKRDIIKTDIIHERSKLDKFSPCLIGDIYAENNILSNDYDLQIIVPAYNVEKYVEECLDSILKQKTKYKILVVVINDGSTDNTAKIISKYKFDTRVKIINQENKGLSGARNAGIKNIYAKYLMFVDSDDVLPGGSIDIMIDTIEKENVDIVQGSYKMLIENKIIVGKKYKYEKIESTSIKRSNSIAGFACMKIIKSSLFKNIQFPLNALFEDTIFNLYIYCLGVSIVIIPNITYIYRINPEGICKKSIYKPKSLDTYWITERLLCKCVEQNVVINDIFVENFLSQVLLNYKRTLNFPREIQEIIFVLTANLCSKFLTGLKPKKYVELYKILLSGNYSSYLFYCKYKLIY